MFKDIVIITVACLFLLTSPCTFAAEEKADIKIEIKSSIPLPVEPWSIPEIKPSPGKNIFKNGDFKNGLKKWKLYAEDQGIIEVDNKVFRTQPGSIKLKAKPSSPETTFGIRQRFYDTKKEKGKFSLLKPHLIYYVECYVKTEGKISGGKGKGKNRNIGIMLYSSQIEKEQDVKGEKSDKRILDITNDTEDWKKLKGLVSIKNDTLLTIWGLYKGKSGTVWIDDFFLTPLRTTISYAVKGPAIKQVKLLDGEGKVLQDSGAMNKGVDNYKKEMTDLDIDQTYTVEVTDINGKTFKKEYPE